MKVIEYLKTHTIDELKEEFGIKVNEYENFWVLNYDMVKSPKSHPIVMECRALILSKDLKVLARTFDRFFNYGECDNQKDFDFSTATVYEKLDGSLCYFWYNPYDNKWEIGTRTQAFAEGPLPSGRTFKEAILEALGYSEEEFQKRIQCMWNYETVVCEFVSLENKVVKVYNTPEVYFLTIRHVLTGAEMNQHFNPMGLALPLNLKIPKTYNLSSYEDICNSMKDLKTQDEGYVIVDRNFKRMKIKNPSYLALANMFNNGVITLERILMLKENGNLDEFLTYFSEFKEHVEEVTKLEDHMIKSLEYIWNGIKHIEDQKEFALNIKDNPLASFLFEKKKKQDKSIREIYNGYTIQNKVKSLTKYEDIRLRYNIEI